MRKGESVSDGPANNSVAEKLGLEHDHIVQEFGYDDDVDQDFREAVEKAVGSEIEDEDYTGVTDAVLLWWRDGDGDLIDNVVDALGPLTDGGAVVLLTPRAGQDLAVEPHEIEEAAQTAGLQAYSASPIGDQWQAVRMVSTGPRR